MRIKVDPIYIPDNRMNEVTSHKVFKDNQIKSKEGEFLFHEDGIFSDRIFGQYNECKCGALTEDGICNICNTRVIKGNPAFYISFNESFIPDRFIPDMDLEALLNYKAFLYEDNIIDYDPLDDFTKYDVNKILFGLDAADALGYNYHVTNKIYIPHTSFRPIVKSRDDYYLGPLNTAYIDLLKQKNRLLNLETDSTIWAEFNIKNRICKIIAELRKEIEGFIYGNRKNVVRNELQGQNLTGIVRGVITNNFSLDEDVVVIGKYFAKTLYPSLYDKHFNNGELDIKGLNRDLKDALVQLNRQPTIGAKSIMAMKPVFSEKDDEEFILQLNPIIFDGLAGDTDGDVLSVTALYTPESIEEFSHLLPSKNYIEGSNGSIRNGLPEDFEYVKELLGIDIDMENLPRDEYIDIYKEIGSKMFSNCYIPNVGDFAKAYVDNDKDSLDKITKLTDFTGNYEKDILPSIKRRKVDYTEDESSAFMASVIAANITDITESGYFYKKLAAATDNMKITEEDCGSEGEEILLPIDENEYNYKIKNRFIMGIGYTETYNEFIEKTKGLDKINLRTFLSCKTHGLNYCKKCAGLFKRSHEDYFTPKYIGLYTTLMITEQATQAALDSMNKGTQEKLTDVLEDNVEGDFTKDKIRDIIDSIGNIGVDSRFYEIALLARAEHNKKLVSVMLNRDDYLGSFIYRPNMSNLKNLVLAEEFEADSTKSKIAFDRRF